MIESVEQTKTSSKQWFRKLGVAHLWWKTVWSFFKKLDIELPYDLAIPLLGVYPEKTVIWKDTCTPMFIVALFTIARTQTQLKCPPTEEWKKREYIHTKHTYILYIHTIHTYTLYIHTTHPYILYIHTYYTHIHTIHAYILCMHTYNTCTHTIHAHMLYMHT